LDIISARGTYTGKLAYVIYFDNKGVLRKKKSWEGWRDKKIAAKDVKAGFSYRMKNGTNVLYLGKYPYSTTESWKGFTPIGNRHIFLDLDNKRDLEFYSPYIVDSGFTRLAEAVSPAALPTFPDELDKFKKSKWYGEIVGFKLREIGIPDEDHMGGNYLISSDGKEYYVAYIRRNWDYRYMIKKSAAFVPEMKDNRIALPSING
jgi:hypothetical protein